MKITNLSRKWTSKLFCVADADIWVLGTELMLFMKLCVILFSRINHLAQARAEKKKSAVSSFINILISVRSKWKIENLKPVIQ